MKKELMMMTAHSKILAYNSSVKFINWREKLQTNFTNFVIDVKDVDMFGDKVGFIKAVVDLKIDGKKIPGITFIRGDSVSILTEIRTESNSYFVLVYQPRIPVGDFIYENPAGMMDESGDPVGVSIQEIEEETGIKIKKENLKFLDSVYTSPGFTDETVHLYHVILNMTEYEVLKLNNRLTGTENELISLKVVDKKDYLRLNKTAIGLSSLYLAKV
jgi:ADP-sugar diphosphatase